MRIHNSFAVICAAAFSNLATSSLIVDYIAPAAVSCLGTPELEAAYLGDHMNTAAAVGSPAFIQPGKDRSGKSALHFHRDSSDRRAEVRAKGNYAAGKQYFVGYEFSLSNMHEHLALFQWKKEDKSNGQNIPFNLQFTENEPPRLSLGYTPGGGTAARYRTIWIDSSPFDTDKRHNIALAWDTIAGNNTNKLQLWLDGTQVFSSTGLDLWTGETYPKFGIYRGEKGDHDVSGDDDNAFDLYVYRVQVSDERLEEVSASSGIRGDAMTITTRERDTGGGSDASVMARTTTSRPTHRKRARPMRLLVVE